MTARARDTWTGVDLVQAGNMARAQADIERLQQQLDTEGYTFEGKINPLAQCTVSLSRILHVHAIATTGKSDSAGKALANERKASLPGNDLIPTLRVVDTVNCFAV